MVDVDRRPTLPHGLPRPPSHAAGLRRLSTRASAPSTPRTPATPSPSSSSSAAPPPPSAVLAHLAAAGVAVLPGLSPAELAFAEAALGGGVQLPPDLRDLLAAGVPAGDGFPDYRSPAGLRLLRFASQEIPAAVAAALPLAPGRRVGRAARAAALTFAGANIADFLLRAFAAEPPPGAPLRRQLSAPVPPPAPPPSTTARRSLDSVTGKAPRWIEFWTDTAAAGDRFLEVPAAATTTVKNSSTSTAAGKAQEWLQSSLKRAGSELARGGWDHEEVEEMVGPSSSSGEESDVTTALALTVDRWCGELRRGGWAVEDVVEMLGALLGPHRKPRRAAAALPPEVAARVGRLAEAVSRAVGARAKAKPPRPS
ncbi:hypothetical protein PR202_gn00332 [Eleusine coracana subsp. coracana]|uniref:Uncharacterized protein n=1 Tax=Eleusine coracana subsp. coracana TaxID=191504 RepID=A0AAV5G0W8_ELECO|nr:hypothetical protein PR202_gn00228 [Eleusine coracana subsp. coracana]GJN41013.1 hypothetical protein PR202_gn00332 [Eleusine coracana subsp. coracana]